MATLIFHVAVSLFLTIIAVFVLVICVKDLRIFSTKDAATTTGNTVLLVITMLMVIAGTTLYLAVYFALMANWWLLYLLQH